MVMKYFSSPPRGLSLEDAITLANEQLDSARNAKSPAMKLQLCNDAKSKIKDAEKIFAAKKIGGLTQDGIAMAYHKHAMLLEDLERHDLARKSHTKAKDWGYIHVVGQKDPTPQPNSTTDSIQQSLSSAALSATSIFHQDVVPPIAKHSLPEDSQHITSTPQLAYCLSLSLPSLVSNDKLDESEYAWSQNRSNDPDEQKQFQSMATDLVRAFVRDDLKKPDAVAEIVCLAAVLDQEDYRKLLQSFVDVIDQSVLLKVHLLDGLAQLIRNAAPGCIDPDDLVKILELLTMRLKGTHQQSSSHIYRLTQAVSRVLDSMVEIQVRDLKRDQLHDPLLTYLKELQASPDPYLVHEAAYAYQALQYIPDDETALKSFFRRTGKVVQGISGVVSAVKALDLNVFIGGLKDIQGGLSGAVDAIVLIDGAYNNLKNLTESGQNLQESLKEGFSFHCKRAWYAALRGLDILLQEGRFIDFEKLIRESPCRQDPFFQWGLCQRLGEIAINPLWDANTRQCAISFLGEMYKDDVMWSQQTHVKQRILCILTQLADSTDSSTVGYAQKYLQDLRTNDDTNKYHQPEASLKEYKSSYPLAPILPPQTSPLLVEVLNKPDIETALRRLRIVRLKDRYRDVYISPRAKANFRATEEFDLTSKVQEFLDSPKKVLLLLGDSGAGKSTFNRALEANLWDNYEKLQGRVPLFVHLPTVEKPEFDLIDKQLRKFDFTEPEIRELKARREVILICDGYDESQQTRNLYKSNQLNESGGWKTQMIISCRTEYTGADYKDCFQPTGKDGRGLLELYQEAVMTPFNKDQIQDYIDQYVSSRKPSWDSKDYRRALNDISNLQDLVKNPFLLKLALEVLPQLVDIKSDLSAARITRIVLYDEFVAQWLERSKIRLNEVELNSRDSEALKRLSQFGFSEQGITFLKDFSTAIYDNQGGNPVVSYPEPRGRQTWKEAFFNKNDGKNLLLESMPLICSGIQYRFIHRSVLEYGLTLAIFDPSLHKESAEPTPVSSRRGSTSSKLSFEISLPEEETPGAVKRPLLESPLGRRTFVNDTSVLLFLVERAQQQPVFKKQLHSVIQLSKAEKNARIAAANAITVLVKAGVQFNGADLSDIKIPGADLSHGVFDSAHLEGADLRKVNFRNVWLRAANLSRAQVAGAHFGELPFLQEESEVKVCAYSPDGKTHAVGLSSGNIRLYDTSDWSRVQTLVGHSDQIKSLAYSPEGDQLASGSADKTVRVWDVETGSCIHSLQDHTRDVYTVVYSPKGDQIAAGSRDKTIRIWDVETGNCIHTLQGHRRDIYTVAYSPNGNRIASAGEDETIRLWDVETGNCLHTLKGHRYSIPKIVYSPKGDQFASCAQDKTARLWDAETGDCIHILRGHGFYLTTIVYSPKGDRIATGGDDWTVRLWDVETGNCLHILKGHATFVKNLVYSPKGDQIASGSWDKTVRLWDVETGHCLQILQGHKQYIRSIAYSPNGSQIASGGLDQTVRLWNIETGSRVRSLRGHRSHVLSIAYSPKREEIASGSGDNTVRLWDIATGNCISTLRRHSGHVLCVLFSPTEDQIASGSRDKTVRLWDVETGHCIHTLSGHTNYVRTLTYSPKGDQIASGSLDATVKIWDTGTGSCIRTLEGHGDGVISIVYLSGGKHIASGSDDKTIRLWDVGTGDCIYTLEGHGSFIKTIASSPKGDQIASGSFDKTLRLWDIETGNCVHTLEGHSNNIKCIVYSTKGNQIASGSEDTTVRLWDVEAGNCIHTLQGHSASVCTVVYLPNGDRVASGSEDKTARLWSIETGQCLVTISGFDGGVESIAWENTFDGQYLVTGSQDKSVRRWQIIKAGDEYKVSLCWSSSHGVLTVLDASFKDVQGLSMVDWVLLRQREATISQVVPAK